MHKKYAENQWKSPEIPKPHNFCSGYDPLIVIVIVASSLYSDQHHHHYHHQHLCHDTTVATRINQRSTTININNFKFTFISLVAIYLYFICCICDLDRFIAVLNCGQKRAGHLSLKSTQQFTVLYTLQLHQTNIDTEVFDKLLQHRKQFTIQSNNIDKK